MADQKITELPIKTSSGIAATDYLFGIDSSEGYQMLIKDLGDYIIQHVSSSLAGSNQTLAAAISALNSKFVISVNVSGASAVEFAKNLVSAAQLTDSAPKLFSATWSNHGYCIGIIRKVSSGSNGLFVLSMSDAVSFKVYAFWSWGGEDNMHVSQITTVN